MTENEKAWIKFERETNKLMEEKKSQYRLVYLPEKDLMPYDDLAMTARIDDKLNELYDKWEEAEENGNPLGILTLAITEEWVKTISMAMTVYKAVLITVYGELIRKECKEAAERQEGGKVT